MLLPFQILTIFIQARQNNVTGVNWLLLKSAPFWLSSPLEAFREVKSLVSLSLQSACRGEINAFLLNKCALSLVSKSRAY